MLTDAQHLAAVSWDKQLTEWHASLDRTVGAIAGTVRLRDAYTASHQQRTAEIAAMLAKDLGLSDQEIRAIYFAAILHDVGKISIPNEILSKPDRLSKIEFKLMQGHAQASYDIADAAGLPRQIADIIWQHHERLDGTGYPRSLAGDAVLLGARVLAVADVAEAITTHRPYRAALGVEAAVAELQRRKGSAYDPSVVDAYVALAARGAAIGNETVR